MTRTVIAVLLLFTSALGHAAGFRPSSYYLRAQMPNYSPTAKSPWSHNVTYSFASDYADKREPRSYNHTLAGGVAYDFSERWSLGVDLGLGYEMIDGQIPKEEQQSYSETVNPTTMVSLSYGQDLRRWTYSLGVHGEPLWTDDARYEGQKGLIGAGGQVKINFFGKRYSMTHSIDGTSLINSYHYAADGSANPDYFWTYTWRNDLRFLRTWKLSYTFGAKMTRYMDGFIGYSYNNTTALSKSWNGFVFAGSYNNGGFTDDGYVRYWYIDQYRRVARLTMSYNF